MWLEDAENGLTDAFRTLLDHGVGAGLKVSHRADSKLSQG
jgi:hypothetical protein